MLVIYFRFSAITNYFSTHRLLSITPLVCQAFRCLVLVLSFLSSYSFLLWFPFRLAYFKSFRFILKILPIFSSSARLPVTATCENYYVRFNMNYVRSVSPLPSAHHTTYSFISLTVATSFFHILAAQQFFPACLTACLPLSLSCYSMNAHNS